MIHNSKEWRDKMNAARLYARRRNKRMAVVGHKVSYRGVLGWHYTIMTATMAQATGHLRRPPVTAPCATAGLCSVDSPTLGSAPALWCELQEGHAGDHISGIARWRERADR
jgi:hypothetical protein